MQRIDQVTQRSEVVAQEAAELFVIVDEKQARPGIGWLGLGNVRTEHRRFHPFWCTLYHGGGPADSVLTEFYNSGIVSLPGMDKLGGSKCGACSAGRITMTRGNWWLEKLLSIAV